MTCRCCLDSGTTNRVGAMAGRKKVRLWRKVEEIPRFLADIDFDRHNAEVKEAQAAFNAGRPYRVTTTLGLNTRFFMFNKDLDLGTDFEAYSNDPETMLRAQLRFQAWQRFNVIFDAPLGLPDSWDVRVDLQNYYEAAWFGAPILFEKDQVPDTQPILTDDNKNLLFDRGIPDSFEGVMGKGREFYEWMKAQSDAGFAYLDRPLGSVTPNWTSTDGPFTVAANLRGATQFCIDLCEEPEYARKLLNFITEATVIRIKAWRRFMGEPDMPAQWGIADDSIQLISNEMYRDFVLPCHWRLLTELAGPGPHNIHLCGDATRHFKTLCDELNVKSFDTGFPVDFAALRNQLGNEVTLYGGPHIALLQRGPIDAIRERTREILYSGVADNAPFVMREGNNLAPYTPLAHIRAFYEAARAYGLYGSDGRIIRD